MLLHCSYNVSFEVGCCKSWPAFLIKKFLIKKEKLKNAFYLKIDTVLTYGGAKKSEEFGLLQDCSALGYRRAHLLVHLEKPHF